MALASRTHFAAFPITEAQFTDNYVETLAYGIYLVTFCFCARTLFWISTANGGERLRRRGEIRWFIVSVFWFIFVVNTFMDVTGLVHNLKAFVFYRGAGCAQAELTDIHEWINIARSSAGTANILVGDFVLIFRCYIVFGRRWQVIIPSFVLYLAGLAMTIKLVHVEITTSNAAITLSSDITRPWWCAFFAITAAQNVLTTSLLIWRIWRVERQSMLYRAAPSELGTASVTPHSRLRRVIRVVAESGLAYSTLMFMTFVASLCGSDALYALGNATLQATGISFDLIIIRSTPSRDEQFTSFEHGTAYRAPLEFARSKNRSTAVDIVTINVTIPENSYR
ncbi:hypothetical protein R3P38DRAFT_2847272 [Favolaschia claudopus]|uniref:Gustatory receptor n=1 Tax=Favolaschia claudopus TaxID=2862362 RepID=A0AAW0DWE1_9AGAR